MTTRTAFAVSMVAAACAACAARAEIVHFVNPAPGQPGHYDWRWVGGVSWESWLDITRAPSDQPNIMSGNAVGQFGDPFNPVNEHSGGAFIAQDAGNMTLALPLGASFQGLTIFNESWHWHALGGSEWTNFTPGVRQYIGVRTGLNHYGWIEVVIAGGSLTAYSWAYETVPGVPILAGQIPAPGVAAMVWAGVIVISTRRRRP